MEKKLEMAWQVTYRLDLGFRASKNSGSLSGGS